ncbi:MAG TPA: type I DNA topoisomerase [Dongiaceae bacterium]|nr:type I DNA topoisomerase [Dongiaceae bacterium]
MKLVIVESPAKAKTINKYLGSDYRVLASFGHVRDLPAKDGSVRPEENFAMSWIQEGRGAERVQEIAKAARQADSLILATDPDREGEAISWHLVEALREKKALGKLKIERVAFNEITKRAVLAAINNPRQIDQELVDAYLARRALDYLVGFTLSPLLWRKMPGSRSAGRVQSVALRIVCEREAEIEAFRPQEYWTVAIDGQAPNGQIFQARLTHLDGKKLDKFDLATQAQAEDAVARVTAAPPLIVREVERKATKRHPFAPFTTSTLQQEASRKLGLGAGQTMRIAQRLYEGVEIGGETVGLITYMRTDGVSLSRDAIEGVRYLIERQYGHSYLPSAPREYKSVAKNAQEAHEAIRPTDVSRTPEQVRSFLDDLDYRFYELIWKRTVASQMQSAALDQVAIDIAGRDVVLRTSGTIVTFDGFLALYQEDRDEPSEDDENARLPQLAKGDTVVLKTVMPAQHFTQPPPRYSEASLIKKLEELGIGRPSTYASTLQTLVDREYVRIEKKRLVPEDRGRLVTSFLTGFFDRYVQYGFTADLEEKLDDISGGRADWKKVLSDFWLDFALHHSDSQGRSSVLPSMKEAVAILDKDIGTRSAVIDRLNETLAPHFFPPRADGVDPRACPACKTGTLGIKLARNGAFIGCSRYPECTYTRPLTVDGGEGDVLAQGPVTLGSENGEDITLRKGPYGYYVQRGNGDKPKRASLTKEMKPEDVTLDIARGLLSLPREVGAHPETGKKITAAIGRFGPYLKHGEEFRSIPKGDDVLTIGLNRAVVILAEPKRGRGGGAPAGKVLGTHPEDGQPVTLHKGRYGPYVKHGKINATLPRNMGDPDNISVEEALKLLAQKEDKPKAATRKRTNSGKTNAGKRRTSNRK